MVNKVISFFGRAVAAGQFMIFGITKLLIVLIQINILSVAKVSVRYNGDLKSENMSPKKV